MKKDDRSTWRQRFPENFFALMGILSPIAIEEKKALQEHIAKVKAQYEHGFPVAGHGEDIER